MSFSFCLNRNEILTLCGMSLLYRSIDLKLGSSIAKDSCKLVNVVAGLLSKYNAQGASEFHKLVAAMIPVEIVTKSRRASDNTMPAPHKSKLIQSPSVSREESFQHAQRYQVDLDAMQAHQERLRRATLPSLPPPTFTRHSNSSQTSLESATSESHVSASRYATPAAPARSLSDLSKRQNSTLKYRPNLDYLSLSNTPSSSRPQSPRISRTTKPSPQSFSGASAPIPTSSQSQKVASVSAAEWESLLSSLDNGTTNIYDAVYGGPAISLSLNSMHSTVPVSSISDLAPSMTSAGQSTYGDWSPEQWDLTSLSMHEFDLALNNGLGGQGQVTGAAQSVLSFSEESLSSGDDFAMDGSSYVKISPRHVNRGLSSSGHENFSLEALDEGFRA